MLTAEEYVFKNMMSTSTFELLMKARSVISSCDTHFQLMLAIQYNTLARRKAGLDWCIDSFIARKQAELTKTR